MAPLRRSPTVGAPSSPNLALLRRFPLDACVRALANACVRLAIAFDNAVAKSFFAMLECKPVDRSTFRQRTETHVPAFDFIEVFCKAAEKPFITWDALAL